MIEPSLESLLAFLEKEGYSCEIQKETEQIYCSFKISGREFPLFIRIFKESELLQLIIFFPSQIKESALNDVARFLHHINKELDLPGFGMDETNMLAFYRLMLPGAINPTILSSYLKSILLVSENFAPAIFNVAAGMTSYASIQKQIKQNN